jgi:FkbM family methyltransferase
MHNNRMTQTSATPSPTPEKILVRGRHGYFMVPANDLVIGLSLMKYGEICEFEWQFVKRFIKQGDVIVDAGTHLGTFAIPFARHIGPTGKVIGFEPQPFIYECLMDSIMLNKMPYITIHHCCVGNVARDLEIATPDYNQAGNFGGVPFTEAGYDEAHFTKQMIKTHCVRLDDMFDESRFNFLKIDVEGMELEVLQGAEKSIRKFRPAIFMENNRPDKSPEVVRTLFDMGYRTWWHTGMLYNPDNFNKCAENIYGVMSNTNMLCLPRERGDGEIPKTLIECTDANTHLINADGKITPSFG